MVRDEASIDIERFLPSGRSRSRLKQTSHVLDPLRMPAPAKAKTSRTKKRQTSKIRTQFRRAENPLGSLGLTARETEVLSWIAQGKTNYEIGVVLSACTGTICKHVEHILCKLKIKNRTAAAVIALSALARTENINQRVR